MYQTQNQTQKQTQVYETQDIKNRCCTPGNRGWILSGRRVHGCGQDLAERNAKFIDTAENKIYEYHPRGFILRKMKTCETDAEGWTNVRNNSVLVASHRKTPCMREIAGKGYCDKLDDDEHRKFHYHFSRGNKAVVSIGSLARDLRESSSLARDQEGKIPLCKYTQEKCWEYNTDPRHKHNFFHLHDKVERTDYEIERENLKYSTQVE